MSELTHTRLSELRRIAEQATPGPWEWNKYLHLFSATGEPVLTKPFSPDNPDVVEARPEDLDFIEVFNTEMVLALLDRIEALEAENERLRREREEIVDSETHFALYNPDLNWWECQAKDCGLLWEFMEDGNPYEHGMRFCPRCGRRIVMGLNKSTVITLKQREHHSAR